jgi:hypothetical protein
MAAWPRSDHRAESGIDPDRFHDALADVLDKHRTAALQPATDNSDSETEAENVPGYAAANCLAPSIRLLPGSMGRGGGI